MKLVTRFCVAAGLLFIMSAPCSAVDGIASTTGDYEIVSAPASVQRQAYESSSAIRIFLESEQTIASFPENATQPGTYHAYSDFDDETYVPSGPVRSYLIHFDPAGESLVQLSGSVTFDEPILAVIGRSLTLEQTDSSLGSPSTLYPTDRFDRELEYQTRGNYDFFRLETDGYTIFTQMEASSEIDQIRVITAVPEPSGWILAISSLLGWAFVRRTRCQICL